MRLLVIICALLFCSCKLSCFAPKAELISSPIAETLRNADQRGETFDHLEFDALLKQHAKPDDGRVDYAGLARDEKKLDAYLDRLAGVDLATLSRDAHQALLINAYNAFTLKLILENYPGIDSIKDLPSPWKQSRWTLAGETVSLDDIEHGLLRPIYGDARIHFAVNCASIGCPALDDSTYAGPELDVHLDQVTRAAMNNPRYARVEGDTLHVTALMNWYADDFDDVVEFVRRYRDDVPADPSIEYLPYDWSLNDVAQR